MSVKRIKIHFLKTNFTETMQKNNIIKTLTCDSVIFGFLKGSDVISVVGGYFRLRSRFLSGFGNAFIT